jgi:hypothetical protein
MVLQECQPARRRLDLQHYYHQWTLFPLWTINRFGDIVSPTLVRVWFSGPLPLNSSLLLLPSRRNGFGPQPGRATALGWHERSRWPAFPEAIYATA